MSTILLTTIVLGEIALLLDLGGRLFGTYAQTTVRAAVRIAIVVAICYAITIPAILSLAFEVGSSRYGLWLSAILGTVALLHLLFPFRFGIQRWTGSGPERVQPLVPGVRLRSITFASELIPAVADGLECLILSDLHCNSRRKLKLLRRVVDSLKNETPDCVFILGDLGETNRLLPEVSAAIGELPAKQGKFLVRSNHDFEGGREKSVERLAREHSICLLANRTIELPGADIEITGVEYPWNTNGQPVPNGGAFAIGLTHTPDNLTHFERLGIPVSVAGHTHGGKLRLPLVGALLVPSKFGRLLDYGWFAKGESRMFVTKGIGYFPGMFGSQGEVLRLRLERSD